MFGQDLVAAHACHQELRAVAMTTIARRECH